MNSPALAPVNDQGLTTADLEEIREGLETTLSERGLKLSPVPVTLARRADMHFMAPDAPLDKTIEMIAASGTVLVIPDYQEFDPSELVDDDDSSDVEPHHAVLQTLDTARQYEGQLCRVALYWSMDGILCCWFASASWTEELQRDYDRATLAAGDEESSNDEARREATASEVRRIVAELMENPTYRSAPRNKRAAVARNLIPEPNGYGILNWPHL